MTKEITGERDTCQNKEIKQQAGGGSQELMCMEGSKINLIQKATGNFPREETFVLHYHRTSRNTTEGVIVSANWRPVTGADLIIKQDPPPIGRL